MVSERGETAWLIGLQSSRDPFVASRTSRTECPASDVCRRRRSHSGRSVRPGHRDRRQNQVLCLRRILPRIGTFPHLCLGSKVDAPPAPQRVDRWCHSGGWPVLSNRSRTPCRRLLTPTLRPRKLADFPSLTVGSNAVERSAKAAFVPRSSTSTTLCHSVLPRRRPSEMATGAQPPSDKMGFQGRLAPALCSAKWAILGQQLA